MKATLKETENMDGKRVWIVAVANCSCDFKTKREAREVKTQVDRALKFMS